MKVLSFTIDGVNLYENQSLTVDFFADKRVSKEENGTRVNLIDNSIYTLNTLSFVGINASGKTTTLNIIAGILDVYITNESLSINNRMIKYLNSEAEITIYLSDGQNFYKLISKIQKDKNDKVVFKDEILYQSASNYKFKKNNFKDSQLYTSYEQRNKVKNEYLKDEDSIFSKILNQTEQSEVRSFNTIDQTDFNYLSTYSNDMPLSFIKYLDPSIEKIELITPNQQMKEQMPPMFNLKFAGSDEVIKTDIIELKNYLSSGTIKGLNILGYISVILSNGGYLIVDEIENHLNKRIITSLFELFLSGINKSGATLIFSTHYVETLDSIERSDSIYITRKNTVFNINKLSSLLQDKDRNDKSKSDILLSGIFNTAPKYKSYRGVKKDMKKFSEGIFNE